MCGVALPEAAGEGVHARGSPASVAGLPIAIALIIHHVLLFCDVTRRVACISGVDDDFPSLFQSPDTLAPTLAHTATRHTNS